ncbi:MAG: hypothetical protein K1X72_15080 [Pyrinomonadaceae bacterium]|nr:hypothetical protein [Pyrinomonadaceae bacterium]
MFLRKLPKKTVILGFIIQILFSVGFAQPKEEKDFLNPVEKVELSEKDIAEIINCFKTDNPTRSVEDFKLKMPPPVTDKNIREKILQNLPAIVKKLQIKDQEITENFQRIVAPVLELFNRSKVYEIIIIRHQTPIMFSDSGVALVISSGMIERLKNIDDLLGFTAHELAHEYFAKASIHTRYVIGLTENENEYRALTRKYWESMGLIEIQCDSFSALTLSVLGYNPLAFIEEIEGIENEFPQFVGKFHPSSNIRRQVVEGILSKEKFSIVKRISSDLQKIKNLLK